MPPSGPSKRNLSRLNKMGDRTEAACRHALIVLAQNRQLLPPGFDLPEVERDLATLDQLRPVFARLRQLAARGEDTEMALGSDILSASLEGYALAKAIGKGAALDALRESMGHRYSRRYRSNEAATG